MYSFASAEISSVNVKKCSLSGKAEKLKHIRQNCKYFVMITCSWLRGKHTPTSQVQQIHMGFFSQLHDNGEITPIVLP